VRPYVVLSAWHTGTGAIRAMTTPVRAVCANTVRAALERARSVYRVRHVGDPTRQLHEARAVLDLTVDYYRQFKALGDRLALEPMSERALGEILAELYPHDTALGGRALRARARARDTVAALSSAATPSATHPGPSGAHGTRSPSSTTTTADRERPRAASCASSRTRAASRRARSS
jgi:hypothetical protein